MIFPWISVLTFLPLAGALVVSLGIGGRGAFARRVALACHAVVFVLALVMAVSIEGGDGGLQWIERHPWIPGLGVEYHVGLDGLGLVMVLLTAGVTFFSACLSDRVAAGRERLYYSLLLLLQCGLFGTFTALNFFHWFLFWELSLVPAYLLIRFFGGSRAGPVSFQYFLYTMVGSVALLLGFLALRATAGTFDFQELAEFGRSGGLGRELAEALPWAGTDATGATLTWMVFGGVVLGFAIKVPLWPFHTWLPASYAEAPSPVTMVLTGVMSKMGVYGLIRIALPIFPEQFREMQGVLLLLALATIVLPALAAFAQTDLKRILAYSSINHLGYCLLALFALSQGSIGPNWTNEAVAPALNGVILQMLNHGLTAATLFGLVEMLERRTEGVRDARQLGGLRAVAPVFCGLMGISVFASVGLPGLNGFVSEFLIFKGVFAAQPLAAVVALLGLMGTAVFYLVMMRRLFHGPLELPATNAFADLSRGERLLLGIPVGLMMVLGVYPALVLDLTTSTVLHLAANP